MKDKRLLVLPIGIVFLGISILMERFLPPTDLFDFLEGLLIGLSIALNLRYVFIRSRKTLCS
ncbi:MAG TPA: hypothetical protein DCL77_17270 [Prolixibacteraceae bacterium]|jgi:hypothetical protein|nr:hypothetical protein [Prolixibacteraceae bacterium]